jgi:WD40 repeat protein
VVDTLPGGERWIYEVTLVRILKGHATSIETVVASPDDKFALTGSGDWTLKLWDLESWRVVRSWVSGAAAEERPSRSTPLAQPRRRTRLDARMRTVGICVFTYTGQFTELHRISHTWNPRDAKPRIEPRSPP